MPGYDRAEITAEFKVLASGEDESRAQTEAAKTAAGESGLAREAGPDSIMLAGARREVFEALAQTIEAALDAGARGVEVKVEAEGDAERFGRA